MGTLHEDVLTFMTISRCFLHRMKNVSSKSCRENQYTLSCSLTVFRKSCRISDNIEKYRGAREAAENVQAHCMLDK